MKTDIEIAQSVELKPITEVVEKVGICLLYTSRCV